MSINASVHAFIVLALAPLICLTAQGQEMSSYGQQLTLLRQQSFVSSFSAAVLREGVLIHVQADGMRIPGQPATAETSYALASVTKQATAALMLKMAESGQVNLTDKLVDHFPQLHLQPVVTFERLLTHTSGLPEMLDFRPSLALDWSTPVSTQDWVSSLVRLPASASTPLGQYRYCNTGYVLLGAALEQASGQPLAQAFDQLLFSPASLNRITYGPPDDDDVASGFSRGAPAARLHHTRAGGAGALYSNARDLVLWTWALRSGRILNEQSISEMFTPRVSGGTLPGDRYGLGWMISQRGTIYHAGRVDGFQSALAIFPAYKNEVHVALLVNDDQADGLQPLVLEARAAALQLESPAVTNEVTATLEAIGMGRFERSKCTPALQSVLGSPTAMSQLAGISRLGLPDNVLFERTEIGESTHQLLYVYVARYGTTTMAWTIEFNLSGQINTLIFKRVG